MLLCRLPAGRGGPSGRLPGWSCRLLLPQLLLLCSPAGCRGRAAAPVGAAADVVDLCGFGEALCGLRSYSGFVPVSAAGSLFYWLFEPSTPGVDQEGPLVLWLQGGPGATSMIGALFELGPVTLDGAGKLQRKPDNVTWAARFPVLFVDSPVGTGWSFATEEEAYAKSSTEVARDLATFLDLFAQLHPEVPRRLVIAGESYGGHFVPALAAYLLEHPGHFTLEAVAVGDGLTDPSMQVLTKPQEAFALGLLDEKQLQHASQLAQEAHDLAEHANFTGAHLLRSQLELYVTTMSQINPYDVRTTKLYDWQEERMGKFFAQNVTKEALHIPANLSFGTASAVQELLADDIMQSQKPHVEELLRAGVRLLLYQGQFDWKDGVVSNEAWIRSLDWSGAAGYLDAPRALWRRGADGELAGYWRGHKNLEQVVVLAAGHMVPMDQPLSALDMISRFVEQRRPRAAGAEEPTLATSTAPPPPAGSPPTQRPGGQSSLTQLPGGSPPSPPPGGGSALAAKARASVLV